MAITNTYERGRAAGTDAANRRMRLAGRTVWNRADYNEAVRVTQQLDAQADGRRIRTLSPVAVTLMARHVARLEGRS